MSHEVAVITTYACRHCGKLTRSPIFAASRAYCCESCAVEGAASVDLGARA